MKFMYSFLWLTLCFLQVPMLGFACFLVGKCNAYIDRNQQMRCFQKRSLQVPLNYFSARCNSLDTEMLK